MSKGKKPAKCDRGRDMFLWGEKPEYPNGMSVWEDQPEGHVSHGGEWNKAGELWEKAWLGALAVVLAF